MRAYTTAHASPDVLLDPAFPYREELLQFIWEQRLFDPRGLRTVDDEPVEVIRPGRLHGHSGPDLVEADVRIGGQRWAGQVEVHVRSSEWYAHRHERDSAYDNVVLHVVYVHDMDVRTRAGARVPTVELQHRIPSERLETYRALMHTKAWVPCAPRIAEADPGRTALWLERLLVERLERKCGVVEEVLHDCGGDAMEAFWRVLAQGFGSKVNAAAFGMLARALPLKVLLKYSDDPLRVEALLFGQAGLLRVDLIEEHPRRLQAEHRLLAELHGLEPMAVAAWRFGGLRPPNFPTVRLAQLAALVCAPSGSLDTLLMRDDTALLDHLREAEAAGYWTTHYRFGQTGGSAPKRLGADAAHGLVINAIVPYLFAMGRAQGKPGLQERALRLLEGLPAEGNSILSGWARLGIKAASAGRSQALLELKAQYCGQRRCLSCVIGASLLARR